MGQFEADPRLRRSLSRQLARKHDMISKLGGAERIPKLASRAKAVRTAVVSLLRKEAGSANAAREVPRISKRVFGLLEDAKRLRAQGVSFDEELGVLNRVLISVLGRRISTRYDGQCGYGEALLNGYIDVFITATLPDTHRAFEAKPSFLINPATGSVLELDVVLEEFRLAFEFQGEHHYTRPDVRAKDAFKLQQCAAFSRVLVPVNISQLSGGELGRLIVNSMVAHCGVHEILATRNPRPSDPSRVMNGSLFSFMKATQRIFLAQSLYPEAMAWLDAKSATYIAAMRKRNPISSTTPAPRLHPAHKDIAVRDVYTALPYVNRYRAALRTGHP